MEVLNKVYFRADGNSDIGLGHVFRSLSLAKMLSGKFQPVFISRDPLPKVHEQISKVCSLSIALDNHIAFENEAQYLFDKYLENGSIVVLDGYHFETDYQQSLLNNDCKVVCIDDIHSYHFVAHAIINHAGGISPTDYSAESYTKFYLGTQYALLQAPFRIAAQNINSQSNNENLFICMGGADPHNDTEKVLRYCLEQRPFSRIDVVVGEGYRFHEELTGFINRQKVDIMVHSALNPNQMAELMCTCGTAITPPSTIAYEYLSVGGALYLYLIADNQAEIKAFLIENGLCFDLNEFPVTDSFRLNKSKKLQSQYFDGSSDKRLLEVFMTLSE